MKKILLLTFFSIITFPCFSQKSKETYLQENFDKVIEDTSGQTNIYIVKNSDKMKELLRLSGKKYKVIFFYAFWCESSKKVLPEIINHASLHPDKFDLFLVAGDNYKRIPFYQSYLGGEMKYADPTFILSEEDYGTKRTVKKIKKFISQLCEECNPDKMAFASYIVYDADNRFLMHTSWEFDSDQKIDAFKKLPLD